MASMITLVQSYITHYSSSTTVQCERLNGSASQCDAMMLGTLTRQAIITKLHPIPTIPYAGRSITGIAALMQDFRLESLCDAEYRLFAKFRDNQTAGFVNYITSRDSKHVVLLSEAKPH